MTSGSTLAAAERYRTPAIILHWLIAALMLVNLLMGWLFDDLPAGALRPAIDMHKSFGITVLGLVMLRILWRLTHKPPVLLVHTAWERISAHAVHWLLYGLMFLLPITGWMHDSAWKGAATHPMKLYFVIPFFRIGAIEHLDAATREHWHTALLQVHGALGYLLAAAFVLHVAGALKHQLLDGTPELQRMWRS